MTLLAGLLAGSPGGRRARLAALALAQRSRTPARNRWTWGGGLALIAAALVAILVIAALVAGMVEVRAPLPIATVTMTAATPMTTPSIVRIERDRLRSNAETAMRAIVMMVMRS